MSKSKSPRKRNGPKKSKTKGSPKRDGHNAIRRAPRNLPAQYSGLVTLVRFANLLRGQRDAAREALKAYETWLILVQMKPPVEAREVYESETERARTKWEQLSAPIWQSARQEFPLVGDRAALPRLADGLVKFEDAGELIRGAVAVDEILRLIASKAAEGALLPIELPQSQAMAPRITIDPATGRALIASDLVGGAILPAIKPKGVDLVDLRRLRVCPVCERLFVAARHDSMACPRPLGCLSVERQRRHRDPAKQKKYRKRLADDKAKRKKAQADLALERQRIEAQQTKKERDARRSRAKGD